MKDWIPLFQTLVWVAFFLFLIIKFPSQVREFLGAITNWIATVKLFNIGKDGITLLSGDLRDSDKISEEEKNKVATELTQKQEEDYVYEDWHNAAFIAYSEKRYEAAIHDLNQALQYAKTKEQTARSLVNQGLVLGKLGRSEEAIVALRKAEVIYSALGMSEYVQQARELIAAIEKEKANK